MKSLVMSDKEENEILCDSSPICADITALAWGLRKSTRRQRQSYQPEGRLPPSQRETGELTPRPPRAGWLKQLEID